MTRLPLIPLLLGFCALLTAAFALASWGFGGWPTSVAGAVYLAGAAIILTRIPPFHARAHFGAANAVTLGRSIVAAIFAGLATMLAGGTPMPPDLATIMCVVGIGSLVADGMDGWLARRFGTASPFGARFDMETDAFLILVLSIIAWQTGKAGVWVLACGAARYVYVAAAWVMPALRHPLFESRRRKTVAVIQGATLVALLSPVITPPLSDGLALAALALLLFSFGADIRWQIADARVASSTAA